MKKCPACAETDLQDNAEVCKHCGKDLRVWSSILNGCLMGFVFVMVVTVLLLGIAVWSSPKGEEMIQVGYGKEVAKSKLEKYAREQGVSEGRALELLKTAAALTAAGEEIKKNPEKYGVRP